jgi:hypothetical protein
MMDPLTVFDAQELLGAERTRLAELEARWSDEKASDASSRAAPSHAFASERRATISRMDLNRA